MSKKAKKEPKEKKVLTPEELEEKKAVRIERLKTAGKAVLCAACVVLGGLLVMCLSHGTSDSDESSETSDDETTVDGESEASADTGSDE